MVKVVCESYVHVYNTYICVCVMCVCVCVCVCLSVCVCVSVFCVCVTPLTLAAPDTLLSSEGRKLRNCLFCLKRMFQVCLALQLHTYVCTCIHQTHMYCTILYIPPMYVCTLPSPPAANVPPGVVTSDPFHLAAG